MRSFTFSCSPIKRYLEISLSDISIFSVSLFASFYILMVVFLFLPYLYQEIYILEPDEVNKYNTIDSIENIPMFQISCIMNEPTHGLS